MAGKKPNRQQRRKEAKEETGQAHTGDTRLALPLPLPTQTPQHLSSLFSRTAKMFWSGIGAFAILLSIFTGLTYFTPQISATPLTTLIQSEPMSTQFLIANDGNLDLHDVAFTCRVNHASDGMGTEVAMSKSNIVPEFRQLFQAKGKIGLPCIPPIMFTNLAEGDISIILEYRPSFWPFRKSWESRFRTRQGDNNKLHWMPDIEPFIFDPNKPSPY